MGFIRSKLKKRLRKKYHLGEFQELGFKVFISFNSNLSGDEFDIFLDDFIDEIEKNNLLFGGGGDKENWEGFITSAIRFNSPTDEQRKEIEEWLKSRSDVKSVKLEDLIDAWHGWE